MSRINLSGIVFILFVIVAVGCSTTQKKPSTLFEGGYRFRSTVTESNCMMPEIAIGASDNTLVVISQDGATLTWNQFFVGEVMQGMQISTSEGNQAKFNDMKTIFLTSQLNWNATILFSDVGFTGTGDFKVQSCDGKFTVVGTRLLD